MPSKQIGNVTISNTVTPGLAAWSVQAQQALTSEMVRTTNSLKTGMKARLKWRSAPGAPGGRFSGRLAQSTQAATDSTPHRIEGAVGVGVHYGKYVEGWNSMGEHKPTVRHIVSLVKNPGALKWLLRHDVEGVTEKTKYFMFGGPNAPSPFMQPELEAQAPQIQGRFAAALARTMNG